MPRPDAQPPRRRDFPGRVRRLSPRAPGPAFFLPCHGHGFFLRLTGRRARPFPTCAQRATPNLNPGVARQMADCATWA